MSAVALSARPVVSSSVWLWIPVLGVGLAALLVGPMPGGLDVLARPAASRLIHGDLDLSAPEAAAIAAAVAWVVLKSLAIIGALAFLEFRSSPEANRGDLILGWIARTFAVSFAIFFKSALVLLNIYPDPLIKAEAAGSTWSLLLVAMPAFILCVLFATFLEYWLHRARHHFPMLWRFHSLHHSLEISVVHNIVHPVDTVLITLFVMLPTMLVFGVTTDQLILVAAYMAVQTHVIHSRLPIHLGPLRYLLADNRYHFIHHSLDPAHADKNFSDVPIWDLLFGTYVKPGPHLVPTGLVDRAPPRTLWEYVTVQLAPRGAEGAQASDATEARLET